MEDVASDLNRRIAGRVRGLRAARGLSLDALAGRSGVSRSMISLVERGQSSPTAVVLAKLAAGLGVTLASLFEPPAAPPHAGPVARREDQPRWRGPDSGYLRRNVSPAGVPQPMRIVEVHFPPRARVAFENGPRDAAPYQQVWVLAGVMDVTLGGERHRLRQGDCLARLGQVARPVLSTALEGRPSAELRRRAEALLAKLPGEFTLSARDVRLIRSVEVLERIGTPEARVLLEKLAEGAAGERVRQEAKGSLGRLKRRP